LLAESVKVRVAERVPAAEGLNTTLTEQVALTARLAPQALLEIVKSAEVDRAALLEPTFMEPNARDVGETEAPTVPRPESATVCGLPVPVSLKFRVAVRVPVVVGAKTTLTVQLLDARRLVPQVFEEILKSAGFVSAMLLMVIGVVLLFVSVTTFCPPVFPTGTYAQLTVVGEAETAAKALTPGSAHRARITPQRQCLPMRDLSGWPPSRPRAGIAELKPLDAETKADTSKEASELRIERTPLYRQNRMNQRNMETSVCKTVEGEDFF
jgi:hypothetical protein